MDTPLLLTKLSFPPVRQTLVSRPRLLEQLNRGLDRPLTLVSAPAGFGKTTLISEWRVSPAGRDFPAVWLTLEDEENDPRQFLSYLIAALGSLKPDLFETVTPLLDGPQLPPLHTILGHLINRISEIPNPFVVVLDDYHAVTADPVHEAMIYLLDHIPAQMRLVILTRLDPPFPLARLRGRNQLTEIRAADLRFTAEETLQFFEREMQVELSKDELAALDQRIEGWITGLQLAALSMRGVEDTATFISTLTGSHRYIIDYLVEEVLNDQPEEIRSFLIQTSILERLTGPLCDAVTRQKGGAATLEWLSEANLFLVSLDSDRRWYRYHHLFADVLRSRLLADDPQLLTETHTRAAAWYEVNGFLETGVKHALAAGDLERAARIAEQQGLSMLMHGDLMKLMGWVKAVEPVIHNHPWLQIYKAWSLTLTGQMDSASSLLGGIEQQVEGQDPGISSEERSHRLGQILAIRSYIAALHYDIPGSIHLARQSLELLPEVSQAIRSVVSFTLGGVSLLEGNLSDAARSFEEAGKSGKAAGNLHLAIPAISALADVLLIQGHLHRSAEVSRQALDLAALPDGTQLPVAARALTSLNKVYYEWNELEKVATTLHLCVGLCQAWGNMDTLVACRIMEGRLSLARADLQAAEQALHDAEDGLRRYQLTPGWSSQVEALRARIYLASGDREACLRWVQERAPETDDKGMILQEAEHLMVIRVWITLGETRSALSRINQMFLAAYQSGRNRDIVELYALQALAYQAQHDEAHALQSLEEALRLAQPEGLARVFLDGGVLMAEMVHRAWNRGIMKETCGKLLAAMGEGLTKAPTPEQHIPEPLSEREIEVLRLVAEGRSNQEIADALVVTVGTIKRHLSNIFGKLDAQSRTQSVRRARELNIL